MIVDRQSIRLSLIARESPYHSDMCSIAHHFFGLICVALIVMLIEVLMVMLIVADMMLIFAVLVVLVCIRR